MQSSYRIFRLFGISVELHITFIIVFFLFLFGASLYGLAEYRGFIGLMYGTFYGIKVFSLFLLLFGTVLIHEFAHSIVALRNGIKVPKITLTPIGGAANIDVPEDPKLEFKVSIAGPLTNFVLLFLSLTILLIFWPNFLLTINFFDYFYLDKIFEDILFVPNIFVIIVAINLILGAFNLIPAFPMDGGRVLRSILALWIDYVEATKIAVQISQILAILMFIAGLRFGFILILIAFFILMAGPSEFRIVRMKHALHGMTLRSVAIPNMRYVNESTTVKEFLDLIAYPQQDHYPVTDHSGKLIGILNIDDIKEIDQRDFDKIPVRNLTSRRFDIVDANLKIEEKIATLLTKDFILVVDSGRVIGYLTPDHLLEIARFYGIRKMR
ncbi:MAG: hypothetical protein DRO76_02245 [Candidatus Altiarchaeales archaeon]|nr:MAG: hypothetical protein DRO76_02245 [Candidatus Altiarchaeales archaeon]